MQTAPRNPNVAPSLDAAYPQISQWVTCWGWVEIGQDDYRRSMVRALDAGGMVWEGKRHYASLDALFRDLERGVANG